VYEKKQMKQIYKLIPKDWHHEIRMFTEYEFKNIIYINNKIKAVQDSSMSKFNKDIYNPRDGELVNAADKLAAFTEVYLAMQNGIKNVELFEARSSLMKKYKNYSVSGIDIGKIYRDFD
ncbi:hydrolase, partial [bacterium]